MSQFLVASDGLPEDAVLDLCVQLLQALSVLEQHHVVHNDIKPDNIFIMQGAVPKIGDLGLARFTSTGSVLSKTPGGTPLFQSPEALSKTFVLPRIRCARRVVSIRRLLSRRCHVVPHHAPLSRSPRRRRHVDGRCSCEIQASQTCQRNAPAGFHKAPPRIAPVFRLDTRCIATTTTLGLCIAAACDTRFQTAFVRRDDSRCICTRRCCCCFRNVFAAALCAISHR